MSMAVDVDVHDQGGPVLPAAAGRQAGADHRRLCPQLHDADALIERIIAGNLPQARAS